MSATDPGRRLVDLDRLADFLDGALSPADAAAVRDLITSDPAWAAASGAMEAARPAVIEALGAYAADTGPMPAGVADRLTESLRALPPRSTVASLARARERSSRRGRAARFALNGWTRAAAVLIVVLVGIGFVTRLHTGPTSRSSTAVTGKAAAPQFALPHLPTRPGLAVTASGLDYSASSLGESAPTAGVPAPAVSPAHEPGLNGPAASPFEPARGAVDPALDRLLDPAALGNCLSAIEQATGGVAGDVDFATYQGRPALIVTLASIGTITANGPTCGLAGSGADEIASTPVR